MFVLSKHCSWQNSQTATQVTLGEKTVTLSCRFSNKFELIGQNEVFQGQCKYIHLISNTKSKDFTVSVTFLRNLCL